MLWKSILKSRLGTKLSIEYKTMKKDNMSKEFIGENPCVVL